MGKTDEGKSDQLDSEADKKSGICVLERVEAGLFKRTAILKQVEEIWISLGKGQFKKADEAYYRLAIGEETWPIGTGKCMYPKIGASSSGARERYNVNLHDSSQR